MHVCSKYCFKLRFVGFLLAIVRRGGAGTTDAITSPRMQQATLSVDSKRNVNGTASFDRPISEQPADMSSNLTH